MDAGEQQGKSIRSKWRRRLLFAAIALTVLGLGCYFGLPALHKWRIRSALARFRSNPDMQTALQITKYLEKGMSQEDGAQALELLTRPTIIIRTSYPPGETVGIQYSSPYAVGLRKSFWCMYTFITDPRSQEDRYGFKAYAPYPKSNYCTFDRAVRPGAGVTATTEPGDYSASLLLRFQLRQGPYIRSPSLRTRLRLLLQGTPYREVDPNTLEQPLHRCEYRVPVHFAVVPQDQAEKIALESNPDLDASVRACVEATQLGKTYFTGSRLVTGGLKLKFDRPARDLVLRVLCRDANGTDLERRWSLETVFIPAGMQKELDLPMYGFVDLPVGQHDGFVELVTDVSAAYRRPDVKAIWDGRIQLPVSYKVELAERRATPETSGSGAVDQDDR